MSDLHYRNQQIVAIYLCNRAYGGPEEGGWWYDCGERVTEAPEGINPNDLVTLFDGRNGRLEANAWRDTLQLQLDTYCNNRGSRSDLNSVICEGRYIAKVYESIAPAFYPATRPHYE